MPGERALSVVIVGAGFGGLAAAIELRRHGFCDVTVLERAPRVGGTWHYNDYPGCACDVPSQLYSFSFAQRRHWSRICSPQREILRYLEEVAQAEGIAGRVRHGVDVVSCGWDRGSSSWTVSSADGRSWRADALVIATGQLHQPSIPRIAGFEEFEGVSFHSARWDHGFDLAGTRVAVVGTGASAVQFVPEVAERAGRLFVFQRTGNWFLPRRNRAYPAFLRGVIRFVPGVQALRRRFIYYYAETLTMMIRNPRTAGRIGRLRSALFMRRQLRDPEVRRKAWPHYTFGCKRVLFSSHYLPALQRPNVELVTSPIERFSPSGIVTSDGVVREVDCVIWGTGFRTTDFMFPMEITGAGGRTLREEWGRGAPRSPRRVRSRVPVAVPDVRAQHEHVGGLDRVLRGGRRPPTYARRSSCCARVGRGSISVLPEVEAASDREVQAMFAGTAWTECDSWYRDEHGRIVTNWPGYMSQYADRLRVLDPREYEFASLNSERDD